MLPPNDMEWQKILARLDDLLLNAAERYLRLRRVSGADIERGNNILEGTLGAGSEPDYNDSAVVAAYAFKYLARRVTSLLGALMFLDDRALPHRVLDVASGSDATSIALHLRFPGRSMSVDAVEPSREMRTLGDQFDLGAGRAVSRKPGTFRDIVSGGLGLDPGAYDLIVMSTGFPYDTDWDDDFWNSLAARMAAAAAEASTVIAIESQAKARILVRSEMAFRATERFRTQQWCCHDMPEAVRQPSTLQRSTLMLQRYYPQGHPVQTWNPIRREYVVVAREGAMVARRHSPSSK